MNKITYHGFALSIFTKDELTNYFINSVASNSTIVLFGYSLNVFEQLQLHPLYVQMCNSFDVLVLDGRLLYHHLKYHGIKIPFFISIPQSVLLVLEIANTNSYSVLLYGSTKENNDLATSNIKMKYPNILVYNGISGFDNVDDEVVKDIKDKHPNILLIGLSTPMKEEFAYKYKSSDIANIIIPCGGMIDVLAGKEKLSPIWAKKIGIAWMFRLFQSKSPGKRLLSIFCAFYYYLKFPFHRSC